MTRQAFTLSPLDTVFFRDGQPFDLGFTPQPGLQSRLLPTATTVIGAIRAALARTRGWSGRGRWAKTLEAVLGDGPENLGALRFFGPTLARQARRGQTTLERLFPVPMHLLGKRGSDAHNEECFAPGTFLHPGEPISCDPDGKQRRLLVPLDPNVSGRNAGAGFWLTQSGFEAVLSGEQPAEATIVAEGELLHTEPRVGLEMEVGSRRAQEGHLYNTVHIRLAAETRILMEVEGLPADWVPEKPLLIPLGGEARMAELALDSLAPLPQPPLAKIKEDGRCVVVLVTDLPLPKENAMPGPPGVISACLGRPGFAGGFHSRDAGGSGPLPLRPCLPAGSVWFCELEPAQLVELCTRHGGPLLGERSEQGLIAIARWPRNS